MLIVFLVNTFNILPSEERKLCIVSIELMGKRVKAASCVFLLLFVNFFKNLCIAFSSHKHVSFVMFVKPLKH